jgi:hypothetical protein
VFEVTRKAGTGAATPLNGRGADAGADASYRGPPVARGIEQEIALLAGLLFCIGLLAVSRSDGDWGRIGWIAILSFQSLPYAAAVICRLIERSHTSGVEQPVSKTFGRPADPEAAA